MSARSVAGVARVRVALMHAALLLVVFASACGAVVNDEAERARLDDNHAVLQQRIRELEGALGASPSSPPPAMAERLIIRRFVRDPGPPAAGALTIELCVETFARGDPLAGIPPTLATSCLPIPVPAEPPAADDSGSAIARFVAEPDSACWATAVPGIKLPACWR